MTLNGCNENLVFRPFHWSNFEILSVILMTNLGVFFLNVLRYNKIRRETFYMNRFLIVRHWLKRGYDLIDSPNEQKCLKNLRLRLFLVRNSNTRIRICMMIFGNIFD